jgi:hypothetical protein
VQTVDGIPRLSSFGSSLQGSDGAFAYPNLLALFDNLSSDGKTVGNLIGLVDLQGNLLFDGANSESPLHFSGVKQVGSLSFGEWTNGTAIVSDRLHTGGLSLTDTQFVPYIVGTTAEKAVGHNMQVNYSLVDATPARAGSSIGVLTRLNISIDLNFEPLVDVALNVDGIDSINYSASAQKRSLGATFDPLSGFSLSDFYATSSDGNTLCANKGCLVNLTTFLSGANDLGAVYQIERPNNLATIGGVAVLNGTETIITSDIPLIDRVDSSLTNKFTALLESNTDINTSTLTATNIAAIFDSKTGGWRAGFHTQATTDGLTTINYFGVSDVFDASGNLVSEAVIGDINHKNKVLSWGSWTNGNVTLDDENAILAPGAFVYYMVGLPTAVLPSSGSATYTYIGGVSSATNFLTSGTIGVDFANLASGMVLDLNFSQGNTLLNMAGTTALNTSFSFDALKTSIDGGRTQNTCLDCQASGFFAGLDAGLIGLKYKATDADIGTINGVAAFDKSIIPN